MNLSIIIPVYNEKKNIAKVIKKITNDVKTPHKVLIIYDFDKDDTIPEVKRLQKKYHNINLIKNNIGNKKGVINAIKTGFNQIAKGAVVVTMADLSDDPKTIDKMFNKLNQGYDIICGSRYTKGGEKVGGPIVKSFLSHLSGILTPIILGIPTKDVTNAFKMYNKKVLSAINIQSKGGFELSMEIVIKAHAKGFKITEVPTVWHDRAEGQSRFKLIAWLPKYIHWYFWGIKKRISTKFSVILSPDILSGRRISLKEILRRGLLRMTERQV